MANTPVGAGTTALALTGTADVSDEVGRAGVAFGTLVEKTGQAVANTQLALNQTGAAMASALATTQVEVIAAQENVFDDQGTLSQSRSLTRRLPLIALIDPVFYQWSEVRLQGQFFATEFVSSNETSSATTTLGTTFVGTGLSFFLGPGGFVNTNVSTRSSSDIDTSRDTSFGRIRASALLEPRADVGVPKPRQVVRGPSLAIIAGAIADVVTGGVLTARTMSALIELRRNDGTPIQGKNISVETEGAPFSFTGATPGVTSATGQVTIEMRREFVGTNPNTDPVNIVVSARLGLVSNSTTVTF
jgi:hypothetical protein